MAASSSLLIRFESLWLGLRHRLVELRLARLIDASRLSIESTRVVTQSLELLVFGTASALEPDARLSRALGTVVSAFFGWDVLRVGATTGLTSTAYADGSTGERFETGLVDARLFRGDGGLGVERVLETAVRLVVQVTELSSSEEREEKGGACQRPEGTFSAR